MMVNIPHTPRWAEAGRKSGEAKRRAASARVAEVMEQVFDIICDAADNNAPCPPRYQIAAELSVGLATIQRAIVALEDEGRIRRHGAANLTLQVEIVATGQTTARAVFTSRKRYSVPVPAGEDMSEELKAAKLFIQRRGYPVYRARVVNQRADPGLWVIGDFGPRFSDADLMTFARQRGWQG